MVGVLNERERAVLQRLADAQVAGSRNARELLEEDDEQRAEHHYFAKATDRSLSFKGLFG